MTPVHSSRSFGARLALAMVAVATSALAVAAQDVDCKLGEVGFETGGTVGTLTLMIHERPIEVPQGLFKLTELPERGGVFAIYDAARSNRSMQNSDVLAADLMTFDAEGRVLAMLRDETGTELDTMESGEGLLYAAYLAAGTIDAMAFDSTTRHTGWRCID